MMAMAQGASLVEVGSFTLQADTVAKDYHISHGLGSTPDFVVVVADEFEATSDLTKRYIANGICSIANLIASNKHVDGIATYELNYPLNTTKWTSYEDVNYTKFLHGSNFEVPYYNSDDTLKAGVTYHYVVGKFN